MALRKPLVLVSGEIQQLQPADLLDLPAQIDQTYLSAASGTYTVPVGVVALIIECIGGGGAGGGAPAASSNLSIGGGGSSGGYARAYIASPAASYTYVVGAGGTGVPSGTGNTGGTTSFGASPVCQATGGGGGGALPAGTSLAPAGAVAPGVGTVGDLLEPGTLGGWGLRLSASTGYSGNGAPSILGGYAIGKTSNGNGAPGSGHGSGGSGAFTTSSQGTGGAGAAGLIIVWEIY